MFWSFLFKKFGKPPKDAGPTVIGTVDQYQMSLDERKEWRLTMMRKSIKETMMSLEIISGMYRYRLTSIDERSHFYAVMMETTKHFAASKYATNHNLAEIEELIKQNAFADYGIVVDAVYWKVNETVDIFAKASRGIITVPIERRRAKELERQFQDTIREERRQEPKEIVYDNDAPDTVPMYEPYSKEESDAFRAALAKGQQPPPLKLKEKVYSTDLAPLGLN
jgi:hypothetical protein